MVKKSEFKKEKSQFELFDKGIKYCVDKVDWKLIDLLVKNSRMSNIEIAEKLDTSEATVRRRIDALIDSGIIRGFVALLDYKKLGRTLKAHIQLKVNSSSMDEIANFLASSKHSCGVYRVIGRYNLYTEIIFQDIHAFQNYIDKLSKMENIEEYDYHIVSHSYKTCPWSGI